MYNILLSLLVAHQYVATNGAVNYCGARMCGHSDAHTFCKYRPGPSPSCIGYIEASLSMEEKGRVLARLNRRRSELARGWRHWPPAGDMMKLRWIEELSREAQRWADQCRPPRSPEERDACRDLYSISVGQCVASIVGEAPGLRPESMVDMWYMQSAVYDGNVTAYTPSHTKEYYGDFAQMVWSRTFLVGCARSRFMVESRGRLRSVERLVCNFAPRGPAPSRPLWAPSAPASMCPPRARPDTLPGLCTHHNNIDEFINVNDSLSVHGDYFLETVFEIERNKTLDYLGSLDELYLTKIAVATIETPMTPLYYSIQKKDILEENEENEHLWIIGNNSEVEHNDITTNNQLTHEEKQTETTKPHKAKVNVIGRPKPYDIDELNDDSGTQKLENIKDIQDLTKTNDRNLYEEYGLVDIEDDVVNITTTMKGIAITLSNENVNNTELKTDQNVFSGINNSSESMVGSEGYFNNTNEETNASIGNERSVEDYLSDPETVQALQDALARMERTLASPGPVSTPGKVRRELRNLEADLQNVPTTKIPTASPSSGITDDAVKEAEWNRSRDRGPMLSMVLKYMPYLKPYESSITGEPISHSHQLLNDRSLLLTWILLSVTCLLY